jgi:hypothetical protein
MSQRNTLKTRKRTVMPFLIIRAIRVIRGSLFLTTDDTDGMDGKVAVF